MGILDYKCHITVFSWLVFSPFADSQWPFIHPSPLSVLFFKPVYHSNSLPFRVSLLIKFHSSSSIPRNIHPSVFKVRTQIFTGQNAYHLAENDPRFEFLAFVNFGRLDFKLLATLTSYMRALQKKRRLQVTFVLLTNITSTCPLC